MPSQMCLLDIHVRYWVGKQKREHEKIGPDIKNWGSLTDGSVSIAIRLAAKWDEQRSRQSSQGGRGGADEQWVGQEPGENLTSQASKKFQGELNCQLIMVLINKEVSTGAGAAERPCCCGGGDDIERPDGRGHGGQPASSVHMGKWDQEMNTNSSPGFTSFSTRSLLDD